MWACECIQGAPVHAQQRSIDDRPRGLDAQVLVRRQHDVRVDERLEGAVRLRSGSPLIFADLGRSDLDQISIDLDARLLLGVLSVVHVDAEPIADALAHLGAPLVEEHDRHDNERRLPRRAGTSGPPVAGHIRMCVAPSSSSSAGWRP